MPTVLVVDDEPNIIEVLEIVLQDEGMEVLRSGSGREALLLLKERAVDVVISDIRMPDFSGVELLREAKQLSPDTVFIMITAFASTETAIEALQHGAYDYRNPNLAAVMKELGYVQRFGMGIAMARQAMADNGNPPLEFQVEDPFIGVVLRRRP